MAWNWQNLSALDGQIAMSMAVLKSSYLDMAFVGDRTKSFARMKMLDGITARTLSYIKSWLVIPFDPNWA
jgi:hypothetical protein